MAKLRKTPSPLTVLVVVTMIAALATWFLPAGQYDKLSYNQKSFSITTPSGTKTLPLTQRSLDSIRIRIALVKFTSGDIRKPIM